MKAIFIFLARALCSDMLSMEDASGWVRVQDSIGNSTFGEGTEASTMSVSPYTDTNMYACGFEAREKTSGYDGIWILSLIYCH